MPLANGEGVALYAQVREAIRERIATGELKPGERLLPEEELATLMGASRMTIRRGILDLIDEGLLYRRRGVGTFVAQRHIDRNHNRLSSYFESAAEEGFKPRIEVLVREITGAKHLVARALNLRDDEPVVRVRTLRLADDEPLAIHDEHVPYRLFPDILDADIATRQLWELLSDHGYPIKRAVQRVEARVAEEEIAQLLGIEEGAPILYKLRTVYSEDGTPVEFAICHNRGDRYSLTTTLSR
jgi:GntR family transcriptional regulator